MIAEFAGNCNPEPLRVQGGGFIKFFMHRESTNDSLLLLCKMFYVIVECAMMLFEAGIIKCNKIILIGTCGF